MKKTMLGVVIGVGILALAPAAGAAEDGAALYAKSCAKCHGKEGKAETKIGQKLKIKDMTTAEWQKISDADFLTAVKDGKGEVDEDGEKAMPAMGKKLNDEQIKATLAFIRTLKK